MNTIQLKVLLPTEVLVDEPAQKIIAEAANGSFCLRPKHRDFATALVPALLEFVDGEGKIHYLAHDEGLLIKHGDEVLVSARHGVRGTKVGELEAMIKERFETLDEKERVARSAVAHLESDFVRRFLLLEDGHGR